MKRVAIVILFLATALACEKEELPGSGFLAISIPLPQISIPGKFVGLSDPVSLVLSIDDANGNQHFPIVKTEDGGFRVDEFVVPARNITITKLVLLDENGLAVYLTPYAEIVAADIVENPLPITIELAKDEHKVLEIQVVPIIDEPTVYGYADLGFDVGLFSPIKSVTIITNGNLNSYQKISYTYSDNVTTLNYLNCGETCDETGNVDHYEYDELNRLKRWRTTFQGIDQYKYTYFYKDDLIEKIALYPQQDTVTFYYENGGKTPHHTIKTDNGDIPNNTEYLRTDYTYKMSARSLNLLRTYILTDETTVMGGEVNLKWDSRRNFLPTNYETPFGDFNPFQLGGNVYHCIDARLFLACESSVAYTYNLAGLPVKATYTNPAGCLWGNLDGAVIEFIYEFY